MTTYKLPNAFLFALQTDRKELLAEFIASPVLTEKEQSELVRLVGDLIEDRRHLEEKLDLLQQVTAMTVQNIFGGARKLEKAFEVFHEFKTRDEMQEVLRRKPEGADGD